MGALRILSVFLSLLIGMKVTASPEICISPDVECVFEEDNLLETVIPVPSLEECRQLCVDKSLKVTVNSSAILTKMLSQFP